MTGFTGWWPLRPLCVVQHQVEWMEGGVDGLSAWLVNLRDRARVEWGSLAGPAGPKLSQALSRIPV